ncbi:pheromone-processing carboxypeptidase KEX1 [Pyrus x bretschneideri]|uniref:pheromone-processing carboxypeptidase KEX1 n=1 Tax=Pyrus x bretschneideri TaxID=225117 RepID=UPI00202FDAB9|nr:pheromone-processing carboxypeptidase KEX1 [Pyrus x bretschneideri]
MESCATEKKGIWVGSLLEAMVVDTVVAAHNSLALLLLATGALMNGINMSPELTAITGRFPFKELLKVEKPGVENKDASDTEDDNEDEDDEEVDDPEDDDARDEDFSGDEGADKEGDPEDDPEANGDGGSDEDDDEEDDDDDDGDDDDDEDEDGEEEEEEEEEIPQPPAKKRK